MKLTTFEDFVSNHVRFLQKLNNQDRWDRWLEQLKGIQNSRKENQFLSTLVVAGCYEEHDAWIKWCWDHFGPYQGKCVEWQSHSPACSYAINAGKDEEGCLVEFEEHSHFGSWRQIWYMKTGYDYGPAEYCFRNLKDRDSFLTAIPTIL